MHCYYNLKDRKSESETNEQKMHMPKKKQTTKIYSKGQKEVFKKKKKKRKSRSN